MPVKVYQPRPAPVQAIILRTAADCKEALKTIAGDGAFLLHHGRKVVGVGSHSYNAHLHEVIVRHPDGKVKSMSYYDFQKEYQPCTEDIQRQDISNQAWGLLSEDGSWDPKAGLELVHLGLAEVTGIEFTSAGEKLSKIAQADEE